MSSTRISTPAAWAVLVLSVAQALAVFIPLLTFGGQPNDDDVDLFISPTGYAFGIWAVIYLLSIATGVVFVRTRTTGTGSAQRLAIDLAVACGAAALWLVVSAASIEWLPAVLLTVMTVVLLDAAVIAAGPADDAPPAVTTLVRVTIGVYAAWASAAVFVNWASDLGSSVADPTSAGWQVAFLVAAAALGSAVTFVVGSSVIAYPLTLLWAFVAIIVNATGESTTVVVVAVVGIVAVIVAYLGSVKSRERRDEVSARR
ncbi:MFS transporter [Gordonia sp. NPDC003422]